PTLPGVPQVPSPVLVAGADEAVARIGKVTPAQATYAADMRAAIPKPLREAARDPFSARALVYCLLLDPSTEVRKSQLDRLQAEADPRDFTETIRLAPLVAESLDAARLPLLDLTIPALRRMSPAQHDVFRRQVDHLTASDMRLSVCESMLSCVLERSLDANYRRTRLKIVDRRPTEPPTPHVVSVLSLLAWEGSDMEAAARQAFDAGMHHYMRGANPYTLLPREECRVDDLDQHLRSLASGSLGAKRRVLLACVACITADNKATVREVELYRAIGIVLDCPVPPLA